MNAYRNGALEVFTMVGWFNSNSKLQTFLQGLYISKKDHEDWYGDKKMANEMVKEDLEKHLHCNLKMLNFRGSTLGGFPTNFKQLLK